MRCGASEASLRALLPDRCAGISLNVCSRKDEWLVWVGLRRSPKSQFGHKRSFERVVQIGLERTLAHAPNQIMSPYHLVGTQQDGLWDGDAKCFGGLEVDNEFELCGLLDWQAGGLGAL